MPTARWWSTWKSVRAGKRVKVRSKQLRFTSPFRSINQNAWLLLTCVITCMFIGPGEKVPEDAVAVIVFHYPGKVSRIVKAIGVLVGYNGAVHQVRGRLSRVGQPGSGLHIPQHFRPAEMILPAGTITGPVSPGRSTRQQGVPYAGCFRSSGKPPGYRPVNHSN